jgi:hypothetical protein
MCYLLTTFAVSVCVQVPYLKPENLQLYIRTNYIGLRRPTTTQACTKIYSQFPLYDVINKALTAIFRCLITGLPLNYLLFDD